MIVAKQRKRKQWERKSACLRGRTVCLYEDCVYRMEWFFFLFCLLKTAKYQRKKTKKHCSCDRFAKIQKSRNLKLRSRRRSLSCSRSLNTDPTEMQPPGTEPGSELDQKECRLWAEEWGMRHPNHAEVKPKETLSWNINLREELVADGPGAGWPPSRWANTHRFPIIPCSTGSKLCSSNAAPSPA